jgi:hypothetical protein
VVELGVVEPGIVELGDVEPGEVELGEVELGEVELGVVLPGVVLPGVVCPGVACGVEPGVVEPGVVVCPGVWAMARPVDINTAKPIVFSVFMKMSPLWISLRVEAVAPAPSEYWVFTIRCPKAC